jgi:hypothetical protein
MTSESRAPEQATTHARITPEVVAAAKARVGKLRPGFVAAQDPEMNSEAHPDTIRRYATGIGDLNSLWTNPEYGKGTRWRSVIAPPTYSVGGYAEEPPPGMELPGRGDPLRGLHAFQSYWEETYYRPIYPGDRCSILPYIENVEEKRSEFGGVSIRMGYLHRTKNLRGDIVRVTRMATFHTERGTAGERGKYKDVRRHVYTPEEMAEIDAACENEQVRGAAPRYWEDVQVGEALPQIVRGPYTIQTFIGYCVGTGNFGAFGDGPLRRGYLRRKAIPAFYFRDAYGIPLSAWTCHFEEEIARAAGNPLPYDVGVMREAWLTTLLTNWVGDDGWVYRTRVEARRFNYLGDVQWCRGIVIDKRVEDDLYVVDIEMHCENQRGEITTPGNATVILPSREHGPVKLPLPPRDLP